MPVMCWDTRLGRCYLKVAICITQRDEFVVAVALYEPVLVTLRSSAMLPKTLTIRLTNPDPAAVNLVSVVPAPNISSLATVVVTEPLFAAVPDPLAQIGRA